MRPLSQPDEPRPAATIVGCTMQQLATLYINADGSLPQPSPRRRSTIRVHSTGARLSDRTDRRPLHQRSPRVPTTAPGGRGQAAAAAAAAAARVPSRGDHSLGSGLAAAAAAARGSQHSHRDRGSLYESEDFWRDGVQHFCSV
jgi:hypothetical protein